MLELLLRMNRTVQFASTHRLFGPQQKLSKGFHNACYVWPQGSRVHLTAAPLLLLL